MPGNIFANGVSLSIPLASSSTWLVSSNQPSGRLFEAVTDSPTGRRDFGISWIVHDF